MPQTPIGMGTVTGYIANHSTLYSAIYTEKIQSVTQHLQREDHGRQDFSCSILEEPGMHL